MRADLNKQLCERERIGHSRHYGEVRNLKDFNPRAGDEGENLPAREPMKARYRMGWGNDQKQFNENLNPLWGNVRKAVGKPWDKFYSELCKNFDKRSVINQHIIQHLEQFVEIKDIYVGDDGELYVRNPYGQDEAIKSGRTEYYVDPRDGILKLNKHYKNYKQINREREAERQRERDKVFRQIDADNVLRFIDGVWFHFEMKDIPEGKMVYEKPLGVHEFRLGYAALGRGLITKTWEEMNQQERQRYGKGRMVGQTVHDVFLGKTVTKTAGGQIIGVWENIRGNFPGGKYHAVKHTASHKMLKKAGIV